MVSHFVASVKSLVFVLRHPVAQLFGHLEKVHPPARCQNRCLFCTLKDGGTSQAVPKYQKEHGTVWGKIHALR